MRFGTIGGGFLCAAAVAASLTIGGSTAAQVRAIRPPIWFQASAGERCEVIANAASDSDRLRMYLEFKTYADALLAKNERELARDLAEIDRINAAIAGFEKKRESAMSALYRESVKPFTVAAVLKDIVAPLDEQIRSRRRELYRTQDQVHSIRYVMELNSLEARRIKSCAETQTGSIQRGNVRARIRTSRYYFNKDLPMSQATEGNLIEMDLILSPDGSVSGIVKRTNSLASTSVVGSMTGRWSENRAAGRIEIGDDLLGAGTGGEGRWELDLNAQTADGIEDSGNWCINSRASDRATRVFGNIWGPSGTREKSLRQDRATQLC